jgi:hypothetical protein
MSFSVLGTKSVNFGIGQHKLLSYNKKANGSTYGNDDIDISLTSFDKPIARTSDKVFSLLPVSTGIVTIMYRKTFDRFTIGLNEKEFKELKSHLDSMLPPELKAVAQNGGASKRKTSKKKTSKKTSKKIIKKKTTKK